MKITDVSLERVLLRNFFSLEVMDSGGCVEEKLAGLIEDAGSGSFSFC